MINWTRHCVLQKGVDREARLSAPAAYFLSVRWAFRRPFLYCVTLACSLQCYGLPISFRDSRRCSECSSSTITWSIRSACAVVYVGTACCFPTLFRYTLSLQQAKKGRRDTVKEQESETWFANETVASFPVVSRWPNSGRMGNSTRLALRNAMGCMAGCTSRERHMWWYVLSSPGLSKSICSPRSIKCCQYLSICYSDIAHAQTSYIKGKDLFRSIAPWSQHCCVRDRFLSILVFL